MTYLLSEKANTSILNNIENDLNKLANFQDLKLLNRDFEKA